MSTRTAWRTRRRGERISLPLLTRTPYFCSGCPHNSSTKVPEGSLVGAGIGCHTMAVFMWRRHVHALRQPRGTGGRRRGPPSRPAPYEVGTRLDLFGYAEVGRVERELIQEYRETILEALAAARPAADLDAVVELAELPDLVRGYEQIKLDNVDTYHRRRSELLEKLRPAPAQGAPMCR
ncbi:DUF6537 domain-containing protein [Streptomyces sp. NPDC056669]|uniref:DUF6537 domain-containing protein n=1 Tax=Streptomyces sp. NPDC056669 TaxID=3345903 RepID=UPI0036B64D45